MTSVYPLSEVGLTVSKFKCFGERECGFNSFQPINIIIGRNNSGKSALLDLIDLCISKGKSYDPRSHAHSGSTYIVKVSQTLDEASLKTVFRENTSRGGVPGNNHWQYGQKFIGQRIQRKYSGGWNCSIDVGPNFNEIHESTRSQYLQQLASAVVWPFESLRQLRILAERDVQPEAQQALDLQPNGSGVTNLVRAFINSDTMPREEVQRGLLDDLNTVYRGDSEFTGILCQEKEGQNNWELFLEEETKGDVRLSQSGSSLKSVFIILCMLRLYQHIQEIDWKKTIFSIEEPENNLHPALLRRLLDFIADQRDKKGFTIIITTHSPITIDWSTRRSDSQIIHVQHDGKAARTRTAIEYLHNRDIIEDLDIRASDILQANGVIWVEGPSDRIYLKRWIELASDGQLKEGTHYTIMFYGGKLLSHLDALPPGENDKLISLLSINRNTAVLIDSDRHLGNKQSKGKPRMNLNATKRRIRDEMEKVEGYVWITEGREIENYTPIEVYARIVGKRAPKKVTQYTQIVSLPLLKSFKEDKISLAHAAAAETKKGDLVDHLDILPRLEELNAFIKSWNGI